MGKRSNFERIENDQYYTERKCAFPLLSHLPEKTQFADLCAGNGALGRHLESFGHSCVYASDIDPKNEGIEKKDFLFFDDTLPEADMFIMNPPWERELLHQFIERCRVAAPTWLLFDSDWMFTGQARPYLEFCPKIVSIGRVSWMGNGTSGKDNCAWYLFGNSPADTIFINE